MNNDEILQNKILIRKKITQIRSKINEKENMQAAHQVTKTLCSSSNIYSKSNSNSNSKHIALYYPFSGEISTIPMISKILNDGKNCYLPVITSYQTKTINFVPYKLDTKLRKNKFGILEPVCTPSDYIDLTTLDIIIVPCVAFDNNCYRLGLGGGYYDILLSKISNLPKHHNILAIGIGFDIQLIDHVPRQAHDIQLDAIITEQKILNGRISSLNRHS